MFLMLSRILSHSNCILILVIFNLASSAPLKNSPFQNEQGFSISPKILEIQLPLKIASKEDLVAWSKYVMNLMTSKINLPSILKSSPSQFPFISNSGSKSKEMMKKAPPSDKRQGLNYPVRRLKEPPVQRADEKVVAYPLPMGAMQMTESSLQDSPGLPTSNTFGPTNFGQYMSFDIGNAFQQNEIGTFGNFDAISQLPANMYLPLPPINTAKSYQNAVDRNVSGFEDSVKLQTMRNSLNLRFTHNNELGLQALPVIANNGLTGINLSHVGEPLLTFPFQALITINKEHPTTFSKVQPKDYTAVIRDFPNEFLPYFEKDYTNESDRVNAVFDDFAADTSETKTEGKLKKGKEKEEETEQRKQSQKKMKSTKKQISAIKRQSSVLGDLLRMLGILRKLPKNSTEINVATPVLSILKGTNSQKIQVAFEETPPNRGRRNETFQAQQLNEDDDENGDNGNDDNGNGDNGNSDNGNNDNGNDEDNEGPQTESQEEDDEEEGGSIQAIIDLLPLAAPILEDLSDPESDIDIAEVLQSAIPLLEGLSDPNEEGGVDIPSVLLPLSQKLSEGPEGQGSDSGAILGPIIQLIAPLIGPLSGPLIGPLSRTSSGPTGAQGSASASAASANPLSKPQGAYGQSILSGLIASITAKLSKESSASASESDVKSLVSSVVSGVIAGASAGSSGHKGQYGQKGSSAYGQNNNGNRDTYQASTTYDGYNSYGSYKPEPPSSNDMIKAALKEVLGAFLKLSATSSTSSASLSGASSSSSTQLSAGSSQSSKEPEKPAYGPPPTNAPYVESPPPRPSYVSSTGSPYVSFARRQVARHHIKKI